MGSTTSKEVTNVQDVLISKTMEVITKVETSCDATVTSDQIMDFEFNNTQVISDCLSEASEVEDCDWLRISSVNIENNTQDSKAFVDFSCEISTDQQTEIQTQIKADLEATASMEDDVIGEVLCQMANAATGGSSKDKTYNESNFSSFINDTITNEFVTKMIMRIKTKQQMAFQFYGAMGPVVFAGNNQTMVNEIIGELISENTSLMAAVTEVDVSIKADAMQKTHGPFSVLSDMFGMMGDQAMAFALSCVMIFCTVIIVFSISAFVSTQMSSKNIKGVINKGANTYKRR